MHKKNEDTDSPHEENFDADLINHDVKKNPLTRFAISKTTSHFLLLAIVFLTMLAPLLTACSVFKFGEIDAVKESTELAISCKTDEALLAVDKATQGGGFGASIGDLQRVVILRDAGRMEEAEAAFEDRNKRWNADAENIADAERAIAASIEEPRVERQERTGHRTCD